MPDAGAKDWDYPWAGDTIVPVVPFPTSKSCVESYVIYRGVFMDHVKMLSEAEHGNRPVYMSGLVSEVLQDANDQNWDFDLHGLFQWPQVIRYEPVEHHSPYGWHTDYNDEDRSKLGMSVCVQKPTDGSKWMELLLDSDVDLDVGDALVFPGYVAHRVPQVVSGCRVAVAAWAGGPAWR